MQHEFFQGSVKGGSVARLQAAGQRPDRRGVRPASQKRQAQQKSLIQLVPYPLKSSLPMQQVTHAGEKCRGTFCVVQLVELSGADIEFLRLQSDLFRDGVERNERRLISAAVLFSVVMDAMAPAICSGAASPTLFAVQSRPTPRAFVRINLSGMLQSGAEPEETENQPAINEELKRLVFSVAAPGLSLEDLRRVEAKMYVNGTREEIIKRMQELPSMQ